MLFMIWNNYFLALAAEGMVKTQCKSELVPQRNYSLRRETEKQNENKSKIENSNTQKIRMA